MPQINTITPAFIHRQVFYDDTFAASQINSHPPLTLISLVSITITFNFATRYIHIIDIDGFEYRIILHPAGDGLNNGTGLQMDIHIATKIDGFSRIYHVDTWRHHECSA